MPTNGGKMVMKISPGTESISRAAFTRGWYYHDLESLLACAEVFSQFAKTGDNINKKIEEFRNLNSEVEQIKEKLKLSRLGEIYLECWRKEKMTEDMANFKCKLGNIKKDLSNFVIQSMEDKEIMAKSFTILTLKKLPLTLASSRSRGPEEDVDEEGGEFYDAEY